DVEAAGAFVSAQRLGRARVEAEPHLADNAFRERRDVAQAQIQALACDRMDDMRGVADERKPLADEAARDLEAERKGFSPRGEADCAELRREAQFELGQEVFRFEREKRAGV